MIRSVLSIAGYTFLQQFRNRLYLVVLFFAGLLVAVSLLFGALAADQEVRVILDFGLAATELFGLVAVVFGAVTLVLEEMESRTIYLILTRPLPRSAYIGGRFLGLTLAVAASMAVMLVLHVSLLELKGWEADPRYFLAFPLMALKIATMAALAVFFSLFSSSAVASVVFTFFFWVLGHFGSELRFLTEKSGEAAGWVVRGFMVLVPNLQALNYKDVFHTADVSPTALAGPAAYALLYASACLCLSAALFSRKEF
jgi:ABC-type transport system involved in multi-copper enzyme maturation permease subunit